MKKVELKTKRIIEAFKTLDSSKYQKLSDDDKIKVWKIIRALKPIALEYEEAIEDAKVRLVPSDDYEMKFQKAQLYEHMKKEGKNTLPMSEEEYNAFIPVFKGYMELLAKAINDGLKEVHSIEFEPLSEEAFGKLMASNDWSFGQAGKLDFIIE
jgi:hypothetical protein